MILDNQFVCFSLGRRFLLFSEFLSRVGRGQASLTSFLFSMLACLFVSSLFRSHLATHVGETLWSHCKLLVFLALIIIMTTLSQRFLSLSAGIVLWIYQLGLSSITLFSLVLFFCNGLLSVAKRSFLFL